MVGNHWWPRLDVIASRYVPSQIPHFHGGETHNPDYTLGAWSFKARGVYLRVIDDVPSRRYQVPSKQKSVRWNFTRKCTHQIKCHSINHNSSNQIQKCLALDKAISSQSRFAGSFGCLGPNSLQFYFAVRGSGPLRETSSRFWILSSWQRRSPTYLTPLIGFGRASAVRPQ